MLKDFLFHYGIPAYNFINESINTIYNTITFNIGNIIMGYKADTLYFYENNPNVYISSFIDSTNKLNGNVLWKYNMYTNTFYNYGCMYKDTKFLPILTATIKLHDKTIYDLTEFISNMKVESSNLNYPDINHILGAFEYIKGIIFDRNQSYTIEIMDNNLSIRNINLFDSIPLITNNEKN